MNTQKRALFIAPLLAAVLFVASCELLTSLRVALASAGPLVTSLANAGVFPKSKADAILQDFSDGVRVAEGLKANIDLADTKGQKIAAAQKAQREWLAIYARGNFGANPKIQTAANIADGIFASLVLYYGGVPVSMAHLPPGATPTNDADFKRSIDQQIDQLKKALER